MGTVDDLPDPDFTITFDENLSPQQIRATLQALADYYRARGGVGFATDFEMQELPVEELVHA